MKAADYATVVAPAAATTLVVYLTSVVIYRLFLHPLAKFPGPKLAAITRLYEAYYDVVLGGRYTFKIAELHDQYGPIIRISPQELHIRDSDYYDRFYRDDAKRDKHGWTYRALGPVTSSICTVEHDLHRRRRGSVSPFFSKPAVTSRMEFIQATAGKLRDRIDGFVRSGAVLNLGAAYSAMTVDVATEFVMGESYHSLDMDDFNEDMSVVVQGSGRIWRLTKHIWFIGPILGRLPLSFIKRFGDSKTRAFLEFINNTTTQVGTLVQTNITGQRFIGDRPNLVDAILSAKQLSDRDKTTSRISQEISTTTGAGFETTAHTLRTTTFHLYSNPDILARLRGELQKFTAGLEPNAQPTWTQLGQLPYLTAVITEGLRLTPGLVTRMARIAHEEIRYSDWSIPAGTPVGMTTILMHYDEDIYPDAKKFNPERFVDQEERWRLEKFFAPFSRGARMCLGMHLAWAELYVALATIVTQFDFEFVGTGPEDFEFHTDQFIMGTKGRNGLKVIAKHHQAA